MSAIDDETCLQHIRDACEKILQFIKDKSKPDFEDDELLQLGVVRLVEIIGEAASRIS